MAPEQASRVQMGANMQVLVSDCARINEILPIALAHHVGIEVQEFVSPDNIDENSHTAADTRVKLDGISPRGLHGPFSDLAPASRDRQIKAVTRSRFQRAYELAQVVGAQHLILHTGYVPKTYGHVHANSSRTLQEWIPGLGGRIQYVHLHNNDGILDNHWGLWKGKIDIAGILDLLKTHAPDAMWTIETIPADIEESVVWLRDRGYL
jgi:sugar phosphate isomerase/epimerase